MQKMPLCKQLSNNFQSLSNFELSRALQAGAMEELFFSPKPGLVDIYDNGSHKDLDLGIMKRSIGLLGTYYGELIVGMEQNGDLLHLKQIGQVAEKRMIQECGTNTHKGYIFLSGLILIAFMTRTDLREGIVDISQYYFSQKEEDSNGVRVRKAYETTGIVGECFRGLPAVFEEALPLFRYHINRSADRFTASLYMMARLMQVVEDTTSYHRCGIAGVERIHKDGFILEEKLDKGENVQVWLKKQNVLYKEINLTMGGVADLIAVTFAMDELYK